MLHLGYRTRDELGRGEWGEPMMAMMLAATVMCATPETPQEKFAGALIGETELTEAVDARRIVWMGPVVLAGLSMVVLGSSFFLLAVAAAGQLFIAVPIIMFGFALVMHVMTGISVIVALVEATRLDERIKELRERSPALGERESFGAVLARF